MWSPLSSDVSHIFPGQPLSPLSSIEVHQPFMQFLAELKTDPTFIAPFPPSIHLNPQTTNQAHVWGVCARGPSSRPPLSLPYLVPRSHLSPTSTPLTNLPSRSTPKSIHHYSCHVLEQLSEIRATALEQRTAALGCGDRTTSISKRGGGGGGGGRRMFLADAKHPSQPWFHCLSTVALFPKASCLFTKDYPISS